MINNGPNILKKKRKTSLKTLKNLVVEQLYWDPSTLIKEEVSLSKTFGSKDVMK